MAKGKVGRPKKDLFGYLENDSTVDRRELNATRVFLENLASDKEININVGGGGSSKSHSIRQLIVYKFLTEKNKKILIVRKTMPAMQNSVVQPLYVELEKFGVRDDIKEDRVYMNMFFGGSMIHIQGLDDPSKVKSSEYNYIWIEEATEITKDDFNTVRMYNRASSEDGKMNQIFLTLNPIDEFHWIKKGLIDDENYAKRINVVHSTFLDNPFLNKQSVEDYKRLKYENPSLYRIYTLGEWGRLENLIYSNWDVVDTIPSDGTITFGLDFGWNDPTVLIRSVTKNKEIWHQELLYQSGMTNSDLIAFMKSNVPKDEWNRPFYCDSQNQDRIKELRVAGFNAKGAQKNVKEGIDFLKRFTQHINKTSLNMIREYRSYSWKKDNRSGQVIDEPVKFADHSADAARYGIYSHFRGEGIYRMRWL